MYASRVKISGIKELIDKDIVEAEISAFGLSDAPITQNIGSNINARKAPKTIQNKTLDPIFMTLSFFEFMNFPSYRSIPNLQISLLSVVPLQ